MSAPAMRIGFIGLGVMGAPMACNLAAAGFHLSVFDADPTRAPAIARDRISAAPDLRALAAASDIVITMLPNGEVVSQVVAAPDGIAQAMRPGTLLLDTSSSEPWLTRRSAETLAALTGTELLPGEGASGGVNQSSRLRP
jgi:3-hydroxyisobutyrate dehydrogenase